MSNTVIIDRRSVTATNRNGRINTNSNAIISTNSSSGSAGIFYNFENGLINSGNTVSFSGTYTGATTLTPVTGFTGNTLTVNGDLYVDGNIKASKEVFAYFASGTSENVLNDLAVTLPIVKSTGNTISLNYSDQFEILGDALSIKASVLTGSTSQALTGVTWSIITDKPTFSTVATSGNYTDLINQPTLFNGAYSSLSGLPTLFDGNYNNLSNKPTLFDSNYNSLTNKPTLFSGSYTDLTNKPVLPYSITGNSVTGLVTFDRNIHIEGNLTASKDVIAYVADAVTSDVLSILSVSQPLLKTGTNIELKYNTSQFSNIGGLLTYIGTTGLSSVAWTDVISKPSFSAVAVSGNYADLINLPTITSTIAGATDKASYFTGTKALSASVADSANAVTWSNVSSKPTYFPPDSHTQDWTTITGKPTTFAPASHSIGSHSDTSSYFTGTKANTAATADNATSLGGTAASAFYNSNNFNKSSVAMTCSTLNATSIVVNGWTITVSSGAIYFNNGSNRAKIDASGNLTCSGEITAFGSV